MIDAFIKKFTNDTLEHERIGRCYYIVPPQLKDVVRKAKPFSAGLFLGEEKGKAFMPSAALLDWIAERSGKKVVIGKKAAWLFLCGRDIFGEGIVKGKAGKNELVLVQNEDDENLGLGKVVDDLSKKRKVVVNNMFDKGNFLRRERKVKE